MCSPIGQLRSGEAEQKITHFKKKSNKFRIAQGVEGRRKAVELKRSPRLALRR
jgi:hypothetical protein